MNTFDTMRSWPIRRTPDRLLGGVCAGLAHRWGISPIIIRIVAVLLIFTFGLGLLLYGLAWLFIPEYETEDVLAARALRDPDASVAASIVMTITGLVPSLVALSTFFLGRPVGNGVHFIYVILVVSIVIAVLAFAKSQRETQNKSSTTYPAASQRPPAGDPANLTPDDPMSSTPVQEPMEPRQRVKKQRVSTPAISGRVARLVAALAVAASAISLIATQGTIARILMAFSVGLAIVALGVLVAGLKGLRATWLTALTWLIGVPTVFALAFSLALPTKFLTADELRLLNLGGTNDELSLIYISENRPAATFEDSLPTNVDAFIFGTGSSHVPENSPVIYRLTRDSNSFGYAYVQYGGIREWKVVRNGMEFRSAPASRFPYSASDEDVAYHPTHVNLSPGETIEFHTPEALVRPLDAKVVDITFHYGEFTVYGDSPTDMTDAAWLESAPSDQDVDTNPSEPQPDDSEQNDEPSELPTPTPTEGK